MTSVQVPLPSGLVPCATIIVATFDGAKTSSAPGTNCSELSEMSKLRRIHSWKAVTCPFQAPPLTFERHSSKAALVSGAAAPVSGTGRHEAWLAVATLTCDSAVAGSCEIEPMNIASRSPIVLGEAEVSISIG